MNRVWLMTDDGWVLQAISRVSWLGIEFWLNWALSTAYRILNCCCQSSLLRNQPNLKCLLYFHLYKKSRILLPLEVFFFEVLKAGEPCIFCIYKVISWMFQFPAAQSPSLLWPPLFRHQRERHLQWELCLQCQIIQVHGRIIYGDWTKCVKYFPKYSPYFLMKTYFCLPRNLNKKI